MSLNQSPTYAMSNAIKRPADTNDYAIGKAVGDANNCLFAIPNALPDKMGIFGGMRLCISTPGSAITVPSSIQIRAHIYKAKPVSPPTADQANFATLAINADIKLGTVDFNTWQIGGTGSDMFESSGIPNLLTPWLVDGGDGRTLYVLLEARSAHTPNSGATFKLYVGMGHN